MTLEKADKHKQSDVLGGELGPGAWDIDADMDIGHAQPQGRRAEVEIASSETEMTSTAMAHVRMLTMRQRHGT